MAWVGNEIMNMNPSELGDFCSIKSPEELVENIGAILARLCEMIPDEDKVVETTKPADHPY